MDFSVLMSVYRRERPEWLEQALCSVFDQTCPPAEVVLVLDGPIGDELSDVVDRFVARYTDILKVVPLTTNQGLGRALNEGLRHCSHDLVARMDTDDIAKPERFARQLEVLKAHPEIDIVGSWIDEFTGDPGNVIATRRLPVQHEDIAAYAHKRSPLNHVSVMFRTGAVIAAGGYVHFPLFEDYYLWARMLMGGARMANVPESLVLVRVSPDMYKRRGGRRYAADECRLQREFHRMGFISYPRMVVNIAVRTIFRLVPNGLRAWLYKNFLRN